MMKKLSESGFQFIASFENLKLISYRDQAGIWTIGYGTTKINGMSVTDGMVINEKVARALFYGDIELCAKTIRRIIDTSTLNQNQFDALLSFVYNIGDPGFTSSTLASNLNEKKPITEDLFTRWSKYTDPDTGQKVTSKGLLRRRKEEFAFFNKREDNSTIRA